MGLDAIVERPDVVVVGIGLVAQLPQTVAQAEGQVVTDGEIKAGLDLFPR